MDLDTIVYGSTLATGIATGVLTCFHRGYNYFDKEKGISIATGESLSKKISNKFPNYKKLSPVVDHLLSGISVPAIVSGLSGLVDNYYNVQSTFLVNEIFGKEIISNNFEFGAYSYIAFSLAYWEPYSLYYRKSYSKDDFYQTTADVASPLIFLETITKLTN